MEDSEWHIATYHRAKSNRPKEIIHDESSRINQNNNSLIVNKPSKKIVQIYRPIKNTNIPRQYIIDDENIHIKKVSSETQRAIQQARCAKKIGEKTMTQDDLAKLCSLDVSIIRRYEDGSAVVKRHELNKIGKVLGILLH